MTIANPVALAGAAEVAARFPEPPKGELTLVIGGVARQDAPPDAGKGAGAVEAVVELVAAGVPRRQAADVVARRLRFDDEP